MSTSQKPRALRRYVIGTTALTLLLVAVGGAVRATESGLACGAEWPRCYGLWVPPGDLFMWLEHGHRLLAGVVWFLVVGLAVWAWREFRDRPRVLWPSLLAVVLVTGQAALGAVVVLRLLQAELVTAHLGMAMAVVGCLLYIAVSLSHPGRALGNAYARSTAAVAGLAYLQILVGGHVTGIGAGLAYRDFPLMDGQLVPPVATQGEAYHVLHRALAYTLTVAVIWLCAAAIRRRNALQAAGEWTPQHRWLVKLPMWAATLVVVQVALGATNVLTGSPPAVVTAHLAVASWIWATLFLLAVLARRVPGAGAPPAASSPTEVPVSAVAAREATVQPGRRVRPRSSAAGA